MADGANPKSLAADEALGGQSVKKMFCKHF
jgi:hypothetical protein